MKKVHVKASTEYDIFIQEGLLRSGAGEILAEITGPVRAVIVSDDNVYALYGGVCSSMLEQNGFTVSKFVFPHGEKSKNLTVYTELLEFLSENRMTRKDILVALGGGVVGDLTGFAAATYQRGIRFIQIPTTMLAMVDSSVGGKTAVDLKSGKNQVGCFYQPSAVIIDPAVLQTLPDEEYKCGLAEVIKYSILGNRGFYDELMQTDAREMPEHVIGTCVSMKRDIVERDEFDTGERMLLNFGHSFGHAAEALSRYTILHGQAVAAGMAMMTRSAGKLGFCSGKTVEEVEAILTKYELPQDISYDADEIYDAMLSDKKMAGRTMRLVIPKEVGHCEIRAVPAEELKNWIAAGYR